MLILGSEIRRKECRRCGYLGDEQAFFRSHRKMAVPGIPGTRHPVCIGCELTERNDPTPEARALRKARESIRNHAEKYKLSPPAFAKRYGWDAERIAHDILHTLENTCAYCWFPYAQMGHGLSDVTLDIVDTTKDPYYYTNVRCCCRTCNEQKSTLPPELWARRLIEWREWRKWNDRILENPLFGLPLFDPPALLT